MMAEEHQESVIAATPLAVTPPVEHEPIVLRTAAGARFQVRSRLAVLLLRSDPSYLELLPGLLLLGWGLMVWGPWNVFDAVPNFAAMRALWPQEWVWGAVFTSIGAAQLLALLLDHHTTRRVGTTFVFCSWLFLFYMVILADWRTPTTLIYLVLALSAGWADVRLSINGLAGRAGVK